MTGDIVERVRPVLLNPGVAVSVSWSFRCCIYISTYQGSVSSASTGKFAALRFPFAFTLSELKWRAGWSTSMPSSSESDIVDAAGKEPSGEVIQWIGSRNIDCSSASPTL